MTPTELRAWRQAIGLSESHMARWWGYDRSTWGRWENGRYPVPPWLQRVVAFGWTELPRFGERAEPNPGTIIPNLGDKPPTYTLTIRGNP